MRVPIVNLANVRWRTLEGIDFQVIAPYVMVAKPDRMRATWVWLRKDRETGTWEAYVGPAGKPATAPIARDRSATGALAVAMASPEWDKKVKFRPSKPVTIPNWEYPESRSYKRRPGDYPERATAHDPRWDLSAERYRMARS